MHHATPPFDTNPDARRAFIDLCGEDLDVLTQDLREGHHDEVAAAIIDRNPNERLDRELLAAWLSLNYVSIVQ